MKIAIVHDDLMQWGGAERVLSAISETFPEAPIYTLMYDKSHPILRNFFEEKKIITSFLQKIPGAKFLYKVLFFLHPLVWEQFDFSEYDLVISHTSRFAKSILTPSNTIHLCYCMSPTRFLWPEIAPNLKVLAFYFRWLKYFDQISAQRADGWLANSQNTAKKLKKYYGVDAQILYPFVDIKRFSKIENKKGDYFLLIARLNHYKKADLAIEAFNSLGWPLKIVGVGPELKSLKRKAKDNIEFIGSASEDLLTKLLANCLALIVTAEEDFGMTPLEAQALGKPVIAYGKGGVLESVIEGKTGVFFDQPDVESLIKALNKFKRMKFDPEEAKIQAQKFSKQFFQQELRRLVKQAKQL